MNVVLRCLLPGRLRPEVCIGDGGITDGCISMGWLDKPTSLYMRR
jgi:hypothetical protein